MQNRQTNKIITYPNGIVYRYDFEAVNRTYATSKNVAFCKRVLELADAKDLSTESASYEIITERSFEFKVSESYILKYFLINADTKKSAELRYIDYRLALDIYRKVFPYKIALTEEQLQECFKEYYLSYRKRNNIPVDALAKATYINTQKLMQYERGEVDISENTKILLGIYMGQSYKNFMEFGDVNSYGHCV